jgi:transposase-like protein
MRPARFGSQCTTEEKAGYVLRSLAGETLGDLVRETGLSRRQLSAWRRRFLEGGEAALEGGGRASPKLDELRGAQAELATKLAELQTENRMLARRIALLSDPARGEATHPYSSALYAQAHAQPGVEPLYVAAWDAHLMVREGSAGIRQATGFRPYTTVAPGCDPAAGLEELRAAGITSVAVRTDPMWSPDARLLRAAFDVCLPFAECHLLDRERDPHIRKRHRNRINQVLRIGEVHDIALADHLDRWLELYQSNVERRQLQDPYPPTYFERLASLEGLRTVAVVIDGEVESIATWVAHQDTMYFHESASSPKGMAASAAHAAFAHVVETTMDFPYVLMGPRAGVRATREDGLDMFKRGFANTAAPSYLCTSSLSGEDE